MKTTFSDFLKLNPNCNKFCGNAEANLIFELLSKDESIILMLEACDAGKPALSPVVKQIEELVEGIKNATLSLDDNFTKQAIGLMVKSIIEPFGYRVCGQKNLPKSSGAKKFVSASCYKFDGKAIPQMRVVKKIEKIIF